MLCPQVAVSYSPSAYLCIRATISVWLVLLEVLCFWRLLRCGSGGRGSVVRSYLSEFGIDKYLHMLPTQGALVSRYSSMRLIMPAKASTAVDRLGIQALPFGFPEQKHGVHTHLLEL